jgi:hypothetical protein
MADHIGTDLPLLLTGEANREIVDHAAAHLRSCEDCLQDLVSVVVAHASLESAHRYAAELVPARPGEAGPDTTSPASAAPDLGPVFEAIRAEEAQRETRRGRPRRGYLLAAAAAAVVVVGGGAVIATHNDGGVPQASSREITLSAYDKGTTDASATVSSNGTVQIDATSLPQLAGQHYEVWLTNPGRTLLQPIGWVDSEGQADMQVPTEFMSRYTDLEVSVQSINAPDYAYSGTSVLRGALH